MAEGGRYGRYFLMGTGAIVAGALVARRISFTEGGVKVLDVQRVAGTAATTSIPGGGNDGGDAGGPGEGGGDSGSGFLDDSMKFVAEHWQGFALAGIVVATVIALSRNSNQTAHA